MKKVIIGIICLLLVGAAAYFCLHRDTDKARDLLPADATAAMMFEPAELLKGLSLKPHDIFPSTSVYKDAGASLDFTKPVYAFTSERGLSGMALNVKDAKALLRFASTLGFKDEESRGFRWLRGENSIGLLDEGKLLLLFASIAQQDALRNEMVKLMKQPRHDVPIIEKADKQDGFLRLSSTMNSLPKSQIPPGFDASGAILNASLSIGSKDIKLSAKLEDKDGNPYKGRQEGEELLCALDGSLPGALLSEKPFAWVCIGIKGNQLLKVLRGLPRIGASLMALNVGFFDADLLLKAIDGDVAVVMPTADLSRKELLVAARITNSDFLKNAEDWDTTSSTGGMSLRRRGAEDFVFTAGGEKAYFGVRGGLLYIASSERLANQFLQESGTGIPQPEVAGKYISGSLDIAQLIDAYPGFALLLRTLPQVRELADAFESVSVTADTPQSFEVSIQTKKPVKGIVSNLVKLFIGK